MTCNLISASTNISNSFLIFLSFFRLGSFLSFFSPLPSATRPLTSLALGCNFRSTENLIFWGLNVFRIHKTFITVKWWSLFHAWTLLSYCGRCEGRLDLNELSRLLRSRLLLALLHQQWRQTSLEENCTRNCNFHKKNWFPTLCFSHSRHVRSEFNPYDVAYHFTIP